MERDEIYNAVVDVLEQVGVDKDIIKSESSLQADLGIESIDLLDVQFRLERKFNIIFERGELFPDEIFDDKGACVDGDYVTPHGLTKLKNAIPHAEWNMVSLPLCVKDINRLFTVGSLVNFISSKTARQVSVFN